MTPEQGDNFEHVSLEERRNKVAAHIADMRIGYHALEEDLTQKEAMREFEARPYQLEAFDALWTARENGADRGLIHLATGLGKTSVAVVDYAAFRREYLEKNGNTPRSLFVVHQRNILHQASRRFAELLPESSRSSYSTTQKDLPQSEVTFSTFQALRKRHGHLPPDYFDYIIYDEAHHIEATTYKRVIEYFHPEFQLGLTATPERSDEKDITDHFGEALYTKSLSEALVEGLLAEVHYNIMKDDAIQKAVQNGFDPSSTIEINQLFEIEPRNEEIVYQIIDAQEKIKREQGVDVVQTIIFCADLQHADNIAAMMNGESYHSGKSHKEQDAILAKFRTGEVDTIAVRDMFNEGVDIPDARLIVFLRTTGSNVIFEQQLGRGLRKTDNKKEVTVLDFVATIERMAAIFELNQEVQQLKKSNNTGQKRDGTGKMSDGGHLKALNMNAEFIFTPEMIDLIQTYTRLKEEEFIEYAPEGYLSNQPLAQRLGIGRFELLTITASLNITGRLMRSSSNSKGIFYSPDEIYLIAEYALSTERKPEGYLVAGEIESQFGFGKTSIDNAIERLGLKGVFVKGPTGMATYYAPEEVQTIIDELTSIPNAPEGYWTVNRLANELGVTPKVVKNAALRLQVGTIMRAPQIAKGTFFSPEESQKIIDDYNTVPPFKEGYMTLNAIGTKLGVTRKVVTKTASELGIEGVALRGRNGVEIFYSPDQVAIIMNEKTELPIAPEGYISHGPFSKQILSHEATLRNIVQKLGITGTEMRPSGKGRSGIFYSPEEQAAIKSYYDANRKQSSNSLSGQRYS